MRKNFVNYETGEARDIPAEIAPNGVDYMICETDDDELYAEIAIEDDDIDECGNVTDEADDRHYAELKSEIIRQAEANGIDPATLEFYRD